MENLILSPTLSKTGNSWRYDFGIMDVGDVMECPFNKDEKRHEAQTRVCSAYKSWMKSSGNTDRKFVSVCRWKFVKVTRIK